MTAAEIAAALGNARPDGSEQRCQCPVCNADNLTLRDSGRRLLIKCFNGCTGKAVLAELRRRGLHGSSKGNGAAPPEEPETRVEHEAKAQSAKNKRQQRIDNAMWIWRNNSYPAGDTLIETYLYSRLLQFRPPPPALRLTYGARPPQSTLAYPAMLGLVEHVRDGAVGVHFTAVDPVDASIKPLIDPRKWALGPVKGGCIRLAPAGPVLAVAEGIEDALTFMQATGTPAWAAISAEGLRHFVPPPRPATETIILIEDQDANQTGQKAAADAARRLAKLGYAVQLCRPLIGKDINHALLKLGPAETLFTIEDYQPGGATGDWYSRCIVGADGRTLSNLSNGLLALREDRAWRGVFGRDEMFVTALQMRGLPGQSAMLGLPRPLDDDDITRIQEWLQLAGLPGIAKGTTYQAVELVAREHSYHSAKLYLERLVWDGISRLDDWLTDCLGVPKTEYAMAVGRMFPIAMVARIYQPGCQADHMLILEGPQRTRKSTACRILAGEWFSDDLPPNVASKDAALHLRGKWLVEIAELHAFGRSEVDALKAFITRRNDIYRPPYGRKKVHQPRQCVFVGTTNEQTYLTDPTGGRRYWPITTSEIDVELLRNSRDQLFAEALVRYRRGERWWPEAGFEATHIIPEQDHRFEGDAWEEPIATWLAGLQNPEKPVDAKTEVTIYEVARHALFITTDKIGTADQRRIVKVFQHLGWRRGKRGNTGLQLWMRPEI
jgi:hypothetical protein